MYVLFCGEKKINTLSILWRNILYIEQEFFYKVDWVENLPNNEETPSVETKNQTRRIFLHHWSQPGAGGTRPHQAREEQQTVWR